MSLSDIIIITIIIGKKQTRPETNTEIRSAVNNPNPHLTSKRGPTSLTIKQNAQLMQSIRFALTSKTTHFRHHNMPHITTFPATFQTKFLANSKQLSIACLIFAVHKISEVCTAPVLTLCSKNCMMPFFMLTTSLIND